MAEDNIYIIRIDGSWSLKEFYELSHAFTDVYALHFVLRSDVQIVDRERLARAFTSYPWRGGFSSLNFYNTLFDRIPPVLQPNVRSIQYASPGWIELTLSVVVASSVGKIVKNFADSVSRVNEVYTEIYNGFHARKLLRLDAKHKSLQLAREELHFTIEASKMLAKALGFKSLEALNTHTGNPLSSAKILLSYCRRLRPLVDYVNEDKAVFPDGDEASANREQDTLPQTQMLFDTEEKPKE